MHLSLYLISFLFPPFVVMIWQAILNRAFPSKGAQGLTMVAMVLGYPLYFFLISLLPFSEAWSWPFITYHFLLYSFSAYSYFHVFNMSQTSRRIRLIQSVASGKMNSTETMHQLFDADQMFQVRLERLEGLCQIEKRDNRYYKKGFMFYATAVLFYTIGKFVNRPWPELVKFNQGR